ncbi:hypothetical protein [Embleya hyalina]|uniref:Uncharacterized protein n=1 Tax=Embleya hyalina TaxID=516124 RepID=A0A401YL36_9ACTN|nr:hypothetical protein [Embleya hyalina]GCD95307.1 hypothetical protein EHYA_02979 [Embleya hyalina]
MYGIDDTPEFQDVTHSDAIVSDETADDPEIPVPDAVEQQTSVAADDGDEDSVWESVPDGVNPADATEQRRGVGRAEDEDYR